MLLIEPATRGELSHYRTANRIDDRLDEKARATAAADPARIYRCPVCDGIASPLFVAKHGRNCMVSDHNGELCGGLLASERIKNVPVPLVERRAPVAL